MAEQLHRRLGLEAPLDFIVGQRANSKSELGFGHAGLHVQWLDNHVPRAANWLGNVIQPQVVETIKAPGAHGMLLSRWTKRNAEHRTSNVDWTSNCLTGHSTFDVG